MRPFLIKWLAAVFCFLSPAAHRQSLLGDVEEDLDDVVSQRGWGRAGFWVIMQLFLSIVVVLSHHFLWSWSMFKNYLKIAVRNLQKHKGYSLINILGLSLGMATCIFILLWVQDELSYDRFHANAERIYLVESEWMYNGELNIWDATPAQLAPAMEADFPEVESAVRMKQRYRTHVQTGKTAFEENDFFCVSPSFFTVFDDALLSGNASTLYEDPFTLMLSASAAQKYFGTTDVVGRVLQINQKLAFTVKGVFANFPDNSHLHIDFIAPFDALHAMGEDLSDWGRFDFRTYLLVQEGLTAAQVNAKMRDYYQTHSADSGTKLRYTPLTRIHLYSANGSGSILYVRLFSLIALVVLVVACINFVNLSTARATLRCREVGVRKVVGAQRPDLIRQLMGESLVFTLMAFMAAALLVLLLLPGFNGLAGKALTLATLASLPILLGMAGIVLAAALLSGIYPALYLSAFEPLKTLRRSRGSAAGGKRLRQVLVVIQFAVSIALVVGTLVIGSQIRYIRNKNLGFDKENLIYVSLNRQSRQYVDRLKAELSGHPAILKIAATDQVPVNQGNYSILSRWDGNTAQKRVMFHGMSVDENYFDLMGMTLVEGEGFSRERGVKGMVVNQEAVRQMGLESPLGTEVQYWRSSARIAGVVQDFHFKPLRDDILPLFIIYEPRRFNKLIFKVRGEAIPEALAAMEAAVTRVAPDYPFAYHFLDDRIDAMYKAEIRTGGILNAFTALIILTSCMGLFGLAAFTAQRRTKEIGIRKTLGASVSGVSLLLAREFIVLVGLANLAAWPLGYVAMHRWLQNFTYKIDLNLWYFAGSAAAALLIALLTVSLQAVKAALANPVESLRLE